MWNHISFYPYIWALGFGETDIASGVFSDLPEERAACDSREPGNMGNIETLGGCFE
jgi:hypothetical protein